MNHIFRVFTHWSLLLHIYVSMAGFTLVLLFAITGLTLNHQDFGLANPKTTTATIKLPDDLVDHPNRITIGKQLQSQLGIVSPISDYQEDPDQIQVTFAAPGHRTVVTINRAERTGEVESESRGLLGKLDDLHKGFDSGRVWYWTIDVTAILLTVSSLTGMMTLLSLRARRRTGFIVGGLGVLTVAVIYLTWIPR